MFVFSLAEAENHLEDRFKKDKANGEAGAFTEGFGEFDTHDDAEHEVGTRNDGEETEHWFHVQDLKHGVSVVDWDERLPTFFAGLGEDFPFGDDDEDSPSDNAEDEEEAEETSKDSCARSGRSNRWIIVRICIHF